MPGWVDNQVGLRNQNFGRKTGELCLFLHSIPRIFHTSPPDHESAALSLPVTEAAGRPNFCCQQERSAETFFTDLDRRDSIGW